MTHDLKPCPFCGSEKHMLFPPNCQKNDPYDPNSRAFPIVRCGGCFTDVPGLDWDNSMRSAVEHWNRRAGDDKQRALIETLVKMLPALEGCVIDSITSSKAEVELYQHGPQSRLTRSQGELKELRTLHSNLTAALAAAKEITQ